jgi:hypothetical protein
MALTTNLSDIRFDVIKAEIINFLKKDSTVFSDYAFTGSALNVLIDALAYASLYMSVYSTFVISESFLSTAQLRKNVLAKAIGLGYVPYQYKSSQLPVKMNWMRNGIEEPPVYIPKGLMFRGDLESAFYFLTREDIPVIQDSNGNYYAEFIAYEGQQVTETWEQDPYFLNRYIFQEEKLDVDDLDVKVSTKIENGQKEESFKRFETTADLGPDMSTFFVQEVFDNKFEIYFGDDVIAKKLKEGQIITATAYKSSGSLANGVTNASFVSYPGLVSADILKKWTFEFGKSVNGADKQDMESVRIVAPKYYQRQGRDVIVDDYKAHLLSKFGGIIESLNVWGGEDNDPPYYGRVFFCINPREDVIMTDSLRKQILKEIKSQNVLTVKPVLIDPIVTYLDVTIDIQWNRIRSSVFINDLRQAALDQITAYFNTLNTLDVNISYSKMVSIISQLDDWIVSLEINQKFIKTFEPFFNEKYSYIFKFHNALTKGSVSFSPYLALADGYNAFYSTIKDNGEGRLDLFLEDTLMEYEVGHVDYDNGIVSLDQFSFPSTGAETKYEVTAIPYYKNNSVQRENIFRLRNLVVNVFDVTETDGLSVLL